MLTRGACYSWNKGRARAKRMTFRKIVSHFEYYKGKEPWVSVRILIVICSSCCNDSHLKNIRKVKVKCSRYRPGVAQRVGRGIALLFHDGGTRRGWVVSVTPRPRFTTGKDPVSIVQEAGWAPGPIWTGGKSRPHRDSIPDRPARSQSLYWLSYPTHFKKKYGGSELKNQECMRKAVRPHLGNWYQAVSSMHRETTVSWKEPLCFWYTARQNTGWGISRLTPLWGISRLTPLYPTNCEPGAYNKPFVG